MKRYTVLGWVSLILVGLAGYEWHRTSGPPSFPDARLVTRGPDGSLMAVCGLHELRPKDWGNVLGVRVVFTPGETRFTNSEIEFTTRSRVLRSGPAVDRFEVEVRVEGGPSIREKVEYGGEPVTVFEHLGYRVSIEPEPPRVYPHRS